MAISNYIKCNIVKGYAIKCLRIKTYIKSNLFFNFLTEVKISIQDNAAITNIDIGKEIYSPFMIVLLIASLV